MSRIHLFFLYTFWSDTRKGKMKERANDDHGTANDERDFVVFRVILEKTGERWPNNRCCSTKEKENAEGGGESIQTDTIEYDTWHERHMGG